MTDYSDLVKRLRFRMNLDDPQLAADAIEAQAARIAELEAALKPFSDEAGVPPMPGESHDPRRCSMKFLKIAKDVLENKHG